MAPQPPRRHADTKRVRAVVYCRISADRTGAGLGVARQETECRALAAKLGWTVSEVLKDNDISASTGKRRPGYIALLDGLKAGTWDALIAWAPDRLHRSPTELERFIEIAEASGVAISMCQAGSVDLSTPSGRLVARMLGAAAKHETEIRVERSKSKIRERAAAGLTNGGGARPYGFKRDGVTAIKSEQDEIRAMAERLLAGEALHAIERDLNARGVKSSTGVKWSRNAIKRMLLSPRMVGLRTHRGATSAACWAPVLTLDTWTRVRTLLTAHDRPTLPAARVGLLSGILRCGLCGAGLISRTQLRANGYARRYACSACQRVGLMASSVDDLIVETVVSLLEGPLREHEREASSPLDNTTTAVATLESRQTELAKMWAAGDIDTASWSAAREEIESKLSEARGAVIVETEQARAAIPPDLREAWPGLGLDKQRAIIGAVIRSITVAPTTRAGSKFDPRRVSIEWCG